MKELQTFKASDLPEDALGILSNVFGFNKESKEPLDVNELIINPPFVDDNDEAVSYYGGYVINELMKLGYDPDEHGYSVNIEF